MILEKRACIRKDEDVSKHGIVMQAFPEYSMPSCMLECRAQTLHDICGCLPYYYPDFSKVWGQDTTCNMTGLQ